MNKHLVLLFLLCSSFQSNAEVIDVKLPSGQWPISFDAPPLNKKQERRGSDSYAFKANSERFNLSLFVEPPANEKKTHKDCYEYYWPQSGRNPSIDKSTIKMSETDKYVRVQYDIVTTYQGQNYRAKNVNYYFISHGKWVDMHISIIQPNSADEVIFSNFDNSLTYN